MPKWIIRKAEVHEVWKAPGKVEKEYRVEAEFTELKTRGVFTLPRDDALLNRLVAALG